LIKNIKFYLRGMWCNLKLHKKQKSRWF